MTYRNDLNQLSHLSVGDVIRESNQQVEAMCFVQTRIAFGVISNSLNCRLNFANEATSCRRALLGIPANSGFVFGLGGWVSLKIRHSIPANGGLILEPLPTEQR
jgi:hypothetical protein